MHLSVTIQKVGLEGQGVGHDPAGNIYFVPGALPGDQVLVEFDENAKRYRDARLLEVIQPSPDRKSSECEYFKQCGGCDWLDWEYSAQLRAKQSTVEHVLEKSGLQPAEIRPILGAEQIFGYRNRIQLRQSHDAMGFFKKRSHDIIDVKKCVVADERLNVEMDRFRATPPVPGDNRKIELAVTREGKVSSSVNRPHAAQGFSQIHSGQNEVLRELVKSFIVEAKSENVLELFCGNGNLTSAFFPLVKSVMGVDYDLGAIEQARTEYPAETSYFLRAAVDARLPGKIGTTRLGRCDTLVLDPPRQGVGDILGRFLHPNLRAVIYVSCSPVAFSKDAQCLKQEFSLSQVQPIDMFPHTRHIELVGLFLRR